MHDAIRNDLHLLQQRIESLYDARPEDDEDYQNGLNFAVSGIEQAIGAVGGGRERWPSAGTSLEGIASAQSELHARLATRDASTDTTSATRQRLAMASHLLAQACALLAGD